MSRSQLACAVSADNITIARVKSGGNGSFTTTMCRSLDSGLTALCGSKRMKLVAKLVSSLGKWGDEPVALTFSPPDILTLPAWFPADISAERCEDLCRIEAGFFLRDTDRWQWHPMTMADEADRPPGLERTMVMFYPADPARFVENELRRHFDVNACGLHIEPVAAIASDNGTPASVLELEGRYTALYRAENGKIGYFRYWPVREESERDYFAITELASAQLDGTTIMVTGSAANERIMERIGRETGSKLRSLALPSWVSEAKGAGKGSSKTAMIRAIGTAITALNRNR